MKCPKCGKEMELVKEDFSLNFKVKPEKKYSRKQFWCKEDDIWVGVEVPTK